MNILLSFFFYVLIYDLIILQNNIDYFIPEFYSKIMPNTEILLGTISERSGMMYVNLHEAFLCYNNNDDGFKEREDKLRKYILDIDALGPCIIFEVLDGRELSVLVLERKDLGTIFINVKVTPQSIKGVCAIDAYHIKHDHIANNYNNVCFIRQESEARAFI
ncbi:hypothetical protein ACJX0J_018596, partial [Zea mays]